MEWIPPFFGKPKRCSSPGRMAWRRKRRQTLEGWGKSGRSGEVREMSPHLFLKPATQGKVKDHIGRSAIQEIFGDPEVQVYIFRKR